MVARNRIAQHFAEDSPYGALGENACRITRIDSTAPQWPIWRRVAYDLALGVGIGVGLYLVGFCVGLGLRHGLGM